MTVAPMPMLKIRQWQPSLGQEEKDAVQHVLEAGWLSEHENTREFEKRLAETVGRKYAVATSSGGVALFLTMKAAGIQRRDKVIVPDYQQIALANAVALIGATPIFVDVNPYDANINPVEVLKAVRRYRKQIRAIVPVHMNGRKADMEVLHEIAERYDLIVLEDACQSLGSTMNGKPLGIDSVAACFSFHPSKIITTCNGGAIVTDNEEFAEHVKALKDYGRTERGQKEELSDQFVEWGFNFRFNDVLAAIGVEQLQKLRERVKRIRELYDYYGNFLLSDFRLPLRTYDGFVPWCCDIRLKKRWWNKKLKAKLAEYGIETRLPYRPMHMQPLYQREGNFNGAVSTYATHLWLPTGMHVTWENAERVVQTINNLSARAS